MSKAALPTRSCRAPQVEDSTAEVICGHTDKSHRVALVWCWGAHGAASQRTAAPSKYQRQFLLLVGCPVLAFRQSAARWKALLSNADRYNRHRCLCRISVCSVVCNGQKNKEKACVCTGVHTHPCGKCLLKLQQSKHEALGSV